MGSRERREGGSLFEGDTGTRGKGDDVICGGGGGSSVFNLANRIGPHDWTQTTGGDTHDLPASSADFRLSSGIVCSGLEQCGHVCR